MNGSGSKRPKNSPVGCQMGYTGETVPIPSSRWLMSVVGSLGSSLECPGAMRSLAMRSLSPARCLTRCLVGVSCRVCGLNGVGAYKACHRRNDESLSGCGSIPLVRLYLQ